MYNNIGSSIKTICKVITALFTALSPMPGFVFAAFIEAPAAGFIILGGITGLIGFLISWAFSILVYAFGELVECTKEIRDKLYEGAEFIDYPED